MIKYKALSIPLSILVPWHIYNDRRFNQLKSSGSYYICTSLTMSSKYYWTNTCVSYSDLQWPHNNFTNILRYFAVLPYDFLVKWGTLISSSDQPSLFVPNHHCRYVAPYLVFAYLFFIFFVQNIYFSETN